jgi:hypothetical protein
MRDGHREPRHAGLGGGQGGGEEVLGRTAEGEGGPHEGGKGTTDWAKKRQQPISTPPSATRADLAVPTRARAALVGVEDEADLGEGGGT